jgi:hypothetical protein
LFRLHDTLTLKKRFGYIKTQLFSIYFAFCSQTPTGWASAKSDFLHISYNVSQTPIPGGSPMRSTAQTPTRSGLAILHFLETAPIGRLHIKMMFFMKIIVFLCNLIDFASLKGVYLLNFDV